MLHGLLSVSSILPYFIYISSSYSMMVFNWWWDSNHAGILEKEVGVVGAETTQQWARVEQCLHSQPPVITDPSRSCGTTWIVHQFCVQYMGNYPSTTLLLECPPTVVYVAGFQHWNQSSQCVKVWPTGHVGWWRVTVHPCFVPREPRSEGRTAGSSDAIGAGLSSAVINITIGPTFHWVLGKVGQLCFGWMEKHWDPGRHLLCILHLPFV